MRIMCTMLLIIFSVLTIKTIYSCGPIDVKKLAQKKDADDSKKNRTDDVETTAHVKSAFKKRKLADVVGYLHSFNDKIKAVRIIAQLLDIRFDPKKSRLYTLNKFFCDGKYCSDDYVGICMFMRDVLRKHWLAQHSFYKKLFERMYAPDHIASHIGEFLLLGYQYDPTKMHPALAQAIAQGAPKKIRHLRRIVFDMSSPDTFGRLPLECAIANNRARSLQELLRNVPHFSMHYSGLRLRVQAQGNKQLLEILDEHKQKINELGTATSADAQFNPDKCRLLHALLHGIDPNVRYFKIGKEKKDERNPPLLHFMNYWQTKLLLQYKANVNERDRDGASAIVQAISFENVPLVSLLLDSKADVNAQDKFGYSVLNYAVATKNISLVKLVLDHKADVHMKSKKGTSILDHAKLQGTKDIVALLESRDKQGQ